ncbi:AAA domain-containing protein [Spiroplasma alleghenense]|uniref:Putative helicase n=1 Tax=Spiroplasma alleghenense TaxID=216931 RepID=A0A345Z4U5_9MOLU|nr:AAA domain-containing protein [Spiroplasma alleghenense]AXK51624.1 putative helicase [Spiroplasma alleghenense]
MAANYREILKDLQNRLVSNNTRTNTFFSTKSSSIDFLDLFKYYLVEIRHNSINVEDIENLPMKCFESGGFIINFSKELIPARLRQSGWTDTMDKTRSTIFKRLKSIIKECLNDQQQFSIESLRVGFPFVKGAINLSNEATNFRAPLFFYDLKMTKVGHDRFEFQVSKDFVVNSSIISNAAVYNRINDFKLDFEQVEVSEEENSIISEGFEFNKNLDSEFIDNLIKTNKLFRNTGVGFSQKNELYNFFTNPIKLEPLVLKVKREFNEENKSEFAKNGDCIASISPNLSIGRYNMTSTGIFANYEELKELTDEELENFFGANSFSGLNSQEDDFNESEVKLISKLDYFQKLAIKKAKKGDLVIEGPPGTGKSQTISNIIANILSDAKTALFLTEKKVASEVVFERIGKLSNLALWIHNIEKDKLSIYNQIKVLTKDLDNFMNLDMKFANSEYGSEIDEIFENVAKFKELLNTEEGQEYLKYKKDLKSSLDTSPNNLKIYQENFDQLKKMSEALEKFSILKMKNTLTSKETINKAFESIREYEKFEKTCSKISRTPSLERILLENENISASSYSQYLFNYFHKSKIKFKIGFFSRKKFQIFLSSESCKQCLDELKFFQENLSHDLVYFFYSRQQNNQIIQIKEMYELGVDDFETIEIATKHNLIKMFENENREILKFGSFDWFEKIANTNSKQIKATTDKIYWNIIYQMHLLISNDDELNNKYIKLSSILSKEKGRHNIPRLFKVYESLLKVMFPIKISSPDTSSNRLIFPWKQNAYDFVIFDEASQIFTENALPSLFRAKKAIIAGDPKQLRPSNWFASKRLGSEIDDEDFDEIDDDNYEEIEEKLTTLQDESLLDFAISRFPKTMLKFHYRSNHKELISYSSAAFYENELFVSDKPSTVELPLEHVYIKDGLRFKKEKINPKEAEAVVYLVIKHVLNGQTSIGVITTNSTQMKYIEEMLEDQAREIPELSVALNENSIFVKNIENVQGDERDIIIFSVTFAPDLNGRFINNFGPIQQDGGPNRLNVAITRSKIKMYVVKSIHSSIINTQNPNTIIFKKYLEYVESIQENELDSPVIKSLLTSVNPLVRQSTDEEGWSDSEFELEVFDGVRNKLNHLSERFVIKRQIQQAGYRIDMTIYDKKENKHILAIEADGARYHTSTREQKMNDYYRQEYLENQGWKFMRILSTHWWDLDGVKKQEFLDNILKFVEDYKIAEKR